MLVLLGCCVAAVLVPTPLLELRYFILPALLLRVHSGIDVHQQSNSVINVSISLFVNFIVLYVFVRKPFLWPDGSVARFMW